MVTRSQPLAGPLQYTWFGGGFTTIFIPLLVFFSSRWANTGDYGDGDNDDHDASDNVEQFSSPWWFFGSNMNGNRDGNEDRAPPLLIATYLWSLLVFFGILFYGYYTMRAGTDLSGIVVALVLFANYSLLSLFLLGGVEGAIQTNGTAVDEHGFAGQFGVMMYITGLLWVLFSTIFAAVFYRKAKSQYVTKVEVDRSDYESTEYRIHDSTASA